MKRALACAIAVVASLATFAIPSAASSGATWIFLRDRGTSMSGAEALALARALPAETWARRARASGAALPDEADRPLCASYVAAIAAHAEVRVLSRWLNAVSVNADDAAVAEIEALPFVIGTAPVAVAERASLGPRYAADGTPLEGAPPLSPRRAARITPQGPAPYGPSYGQLAEIAVPAVHAVGFTGNRVRVMMLDTGFRKDHHAFAQTRLLAERDFVFHDGNTQNEGGDDPEQHHHGTGTWAVAGGYDPGHIVGPGYGASFYLAKTEDIRSETQAEEDNYVAALEWADSVGVRVTSASLTYTCFDNGDCFAPADYDGDTAVITRAVDRAAARGILVMNAAGNYGPAYPSLGTPADGDSMVTVGAVDSLNRVAYFSSRGPTFDGRFKPEVMARGVDTWWADSFDPSAYGPAAGTSLSTPLVGGAAALLLEAHPEWSNMDARAALLATADRHTAPDNDFGWGRINVLAAIYSAPLLYPYPFSLIAPADGSTSSTLTPTFRWRRTHDGDTGSALTYRVRLTELGGAGGLPLLLFAGTDTTLTPSTPLAPGKSYLWEVSADDPESHRRLSREQWTITMPASSDLPPVRFEDGLSLVVGPNPFDHTLRATLAMREKESTGATPRWSLFDPTGRRVAGGGFEDTEGAYRLEAPSEQLAPGVYYLEVEVGRHVVRETVLRLPLDTRR
ncbi:MAG: S8 family serine peptidase [Candidatus Eisenbacteria bacterium]